jgi:hypothetical protein
MEFSVGSFHNENRFHVKKMYKIIFFKKQKKDYIMML